MSSPPKGKTRKKKQKAPETEEQKQARKELQAQKEEERKKKKEEFALTLLQETALRERQLGVVNNLQIQYQWRKLMRLAKEEELKREIEVIAQSHEREVDRKDAIISQLATDIADIEAQFQTAIRAHAEHLDRLLAIHRDRLKRLSAEARREYDDLVAEYADEREARRRKHAEDRGELKEIMGRMESAHKAAETESKQEFQQQRQDIKDKNSEEFSALRIALDGKIDALELQFEQANKAYVDSTQQQTVRFKQLTEQDLQNAKTIEINARKLQRLQDALNHWRTKMATNVRECEERNQALKEEKDAIAAHFQELKGKMNRFREAQQRRLVGLTRCVDGGMRELSRKVQRAEKILALAEMNAKLETEEEALLSLRPPVTQTVLGEGEEKEETAEGEGEVATLNPYATTATTKSGKQLKNWEYLEQFFRRVNRVELDRMALERERERLEKENGDLKAILKQYLDGISVNDDAMRAPNPLLITNRLATAPRAPTNGSPQVVLQYQRVG